MLLCSCHPTKTQMLLQFKLENILDLQSNHIRLKTERAPARALSHCLLFGIQRFINEFSCIRLIELNASILQFRIKCTEYLKHFFSTLTQWTRKRDVSEAVLHSDQGFQYTSQAYNTRLEAFGIKGSHSRKATCLDNACIESFFSHLKTEKLYLNQFNSGAAIRQAVEEYIYEYNYHRFQAKLKQRAPIEYRCALAA